MFSASEHRGRSDIPESPTWSTAVADFLADMTDVVAVAAGLLHDVVEDTLTTIERIHELSGRKWPMSWKA
jgi:GTP pyrophosphokinase